MAKRKKPPETHQKITKFFRPTTKEPIIISDDESEQRPPSLTQLPRVGNGNRHPISERQGQTDSISFHSTIIVSSSDEDEQCNPQNRRLDPPLQTAPTNQSNPAAVAFKTGDKEPAKQSKQPGPGPSTSWNSVAEPTSTVPVREYGSEWDTDGEATTAQQQRSSRVSRQTRDKQKLVKRKNVIESSKPSKNPPSNKPTAQQQIDSDREPQIICTTHIELVEIGRSKGKPIVYKPKRWSNSIGRSPDVDLVANSPFVSRKHASLVFDPVSDKLILTDSDSASGTWVNDQRLVSMIELHDGDLIGIGCTTVKDCIDDPECIVLRVTQQVAIIDYPKEQESSSDHRPKVPAKVAAEEPHQRISRADLSAAIRNAMPKAGPSQSASLNPRNLKAKTNDRKRKGGSTQYSSDDSDFDTRNTAKPKRKKAKKANSNAATTADSNDGYRALIRTTEKDVTFLSHRIKKTSTMFVCPFICPRKGKCKMECTTYTALQKHFVNIHKKQKNELQKPVDTAPNNWRRIQNQNSRFHLTTVKLKLCSLLVGGRSVVDEKRQRLRNEQHEVHPQAPMSSGTEIQRKENEMARELVEMIENQATELSKLSILFAHLVYFKVYRLIDTNDETVTDQAFKSKIDWNAILLQFKTFVRSTANSSIPNYRYTNSENNSTLTRMNDSDFFDLCHQYDVTTNFEQWSQNAWRYIADLFETNFKNNVMVHLYARIRNWFYFRLRNGQKKKDVRGKENIKKFKDKLYHSMKFLFQDEKCSKPELVQHELIGELQSICKFPEFNISGRSYFSRLYHDDDNDETKPSKSKKAKLKKNKKVNRSNNGPRLHWMQMVPGLVRLQKWIHNTNMNRRTEPVLRKRKRKRKRKRNREQNKNVTTDDEKAAKPSTRRKRRRKRNQKSKIQDDEAIHHEKLRNFVVVPQHGFAMQHFAIDSKSLFDVVKKLKSFHSNDGKVLFTQNQFVELINDAETANTKTINPFWYYIFKLKKLETATKSFGGRITTNASDVSVQLCRVKEAKRMSRVEVIDRANRKRKAPSDSDSESDIESDDNEKTRQKDDQKIIHKLQSMSTDLQDISVTGVDLGMRNVAASVIRTWHKDTKSFEIRESNVLHKSKNYHYEAGFKRRQRQLRKIVGTFDEEYKNDRQRDGDEPSKKSPDYMKYIRSRLKWFNSGTATYMQRQVYNMKFEKYRNTQQQMTKMAKEIVGEIDVHQTNSTKTTSNPKKCRIIFVGDCSTPANSPVKGHRRSPGDKPICRYIKQLPNTVVIRQDEFRTTKNCSGCFEELDDVEYTKHRLKFCSKLCKPAVDSSPATQVSTYTNKKTIHAKMDEVNRKYPKPSQTQRMLRVSMNRMDRWTDSDIKRMEQRRYMQSTLYRDSAIKFKMKRLWNRDVNAARNIIYLGLCRFGHFVHPLLQYNMNTAFSRLQQQE